MWVTPLLAAIQNKSVPEHLCIDETAPVSAQDTDNLCYWQSVFGGWFWYMSIYMFPVASTDLLLRVS